MVVIVQFTPYILGGVQIRHLWWRVSSTSSCSDNRYWTTWELLIKECGLVGTGLELQFIIFLSDLIIFLKKFEHSNFIPEEIILYLKKLFYTWRNYFIHEEIILYLKKLFYTWRTYFIPEEIILYLKKLFYTWRNYFIHEEIILYLKKLFYNWRNYFIPEEIILFRFFIF